MVMSAAVTGRQAHCDGVVGLHGACLQSGSCPMVNTVARYSVESILRMAARQLRELGGDDSCELLMVGML